MSVFPSAPPVAARRRRRWDWPLLILGALLGGALFFPSLGKLWPLVPGNLQVSPSQRLAWASAFLRENAGVDTRGYAWDSELSVDETALGYIERNFGQERARALIGSGVPLVSYEVTFKRYRDPNSISVRLLPDGRVAGWRGERQEDDAGEFPSAAEARRLADEAIARTLPFPFRQIGASDRVLPHRKDYLYTYECLLSQTPELRLRAIVRVSGGRVSNIAENVVVPASEARQERARNAPRTALTSVGSLLLGVSVLGAFTVFVLRLREGTVRLRRAVIWSGTAFLLSIVSELLRTAGVFATWDPLTPRAVDWVQFLVSLMQNDVWTLAVLVAVTAAGDALDRESGRERGGTLWRLTQGRIFDKEVGASSARGFLIGIMSGGLMAATVLLLVQFANAQISLQPRGFFFFAINSPLPGLSTVLYFLQVALLEELGYRYFSGLWLLKATRNRAWIAVLLPALVYGLTHTPLSFLPPEQPFWARPLVMTLVGCLWGVAFFRYDALTVLTAHLTSDLFIFNWPRLASGDPALAAVAALTIAIPVVPALALLGHLRLRRRPSDDAPAPPP